MVNDRERGRARGGGGPGRRTAAKWVVKKAAIRRPTAEIFA